MAIGDRGGQGYRGPGRAVIALAAVLILILWPGSPSLAVACKSPSETAAMQVKLLQNDLMIAALSCRAKARYNEFATKFRPDLVNSGRTLSNMFRRDHNGMGQVELDRFITYLANDGSARAKRIGPGYCRVTTAFFDRVLSLSSAEMVEFSAWRSQFMPASLPASCFGGAPTR